MVARWHYITSNLAETRWGWMDLPVDANNDCQSTASIAPTIHTSPEIRVFDWSLLDLMIHFGWRPLPSGRHVGRGCHDRQTIFRQQRMIPGHQSICGARGLHSCPVGSIPDFHPLTRSTISRIWWVSCPGNAAQILSKTHPKLQAKHFNSRFTEKMPHGFAWHGTTDKDPSKVCMLLC